MTPWLKDIVAWNKLSLADRLEALRKHYCTGPCGQDSATLTTRSVTDQALREAKQAAQAADLHLVVEDVIYDVLVNLEAGAQATVQALDTEICYDADGVQLEEAVARRNAAEAIRDILRVANERLTERRRRRG